ncbi:MAG TPA: hypothetical protein V6C99_11045 [Oculatellaceae cyanobacterium]|jgi:hypothetical protein
MLRFLYTICDLIAGVMAIASPVAIFHWLAKITGIKAAAAVISVLDPVFEPMNVTLNLIVQMPVLHYNGQNIPTTQGVVACLLTVGFFIFNFCSEYLKTTEQRLDVEQQARLQRRRLQQLKVEQQQFAKQVTGNRKVYMVIQYDFKQCPSGAASFETTYPKFGGRLIESSPQMLALEFDGAERALRYSLEVTRSVQAYYATLRPIDPQPPYQIAIQAIEAQLPGSEAILKTRKLVSYTGRNQILFGSEVYLLLKDQGAVGDFQFQSVGMYVIEGKQAEFFKLLSDRREQQAI